MPTFISRLRVVLTLSLLGASACGDDSVVNPTFGAACSAGTLAAGQVVEGILDDNSCAQPYHFWSNNRVLYESYSVRLEEGRGYHFVLQQQPDTAGVDDVDALLVLYGKNADGVSVPLAVSDDNAGGPNGLDSEFYFVAPVSGNFQLVAATYDHTSQGGYRLSMERCPVVATLGASDVYMDLAFGDSPCLRHETNSGGFETPIVLVSIPVAVGEDIRVTVNGSGFVPSIEMGGAGFDVYRNLYEGEYGSATGAGAQVSLLDATTAGTYTLMVGAESAAATGTFSVALSRDGAVLSATAASTAELQLAPRPPKRR